MILISEPVHFGDTHVHVNSAFIALIRNAFPNSDITVFAEENHIKSIQANAADKVENVRFLKFKKYSNPGKFYWFQKVFGEWKQIIKTFSLARKKKPELLVWLCLFPTGNLLVQIIHTLFFLRQKQIIILHAEMEYLITKEKKWTDKLLGFILKYAIKLTEKNTSLLTLGESVGSHLQTFSFAKNKKIISLQHPYLFNENAVAKQFKKPLQVCTFGALNKSKNAHLFFELASLFEPEIKEGTIVFNTIGKLNQEIKDLKNEFVNCHNPDSFTPQNEFETFLKNQDIALFFYDKTMYQLSASGALFEALHLNLPVISFENDFFLNISEGNKSIICVADLKGVKTTIKNILKYSEQYSNELHISNYSFIQKNSFLLQSLRLKEILETNSIYSHNI